MTKRVYGLPGLLLSAFVLLAVGCGGDKADCGTPEFTSFSITPDTLAAGDTVSVTVAGNHLNFETDADHDEACPGGHLHLYMDDLMTNPLAMEESTSFDATIPTDATAGAHTLIIRLQNHDHTIVEPQVTDEADLTVQ